MNKLYFFYLVIFFGFTNVGLAQITGPVSVCSNNAVIYHLGSEYDSCDIQSVLWTVTLGNGNILSSSNTQCTIVWDYSYMYPIGQVSATVEYECPNSNSTVFYYFNSNIIGLGVCPSIQGPSSIVAGEDFSVTYSVPDLYTSSNGGPEEVYNWSVSSNVNFSHVNGHPEKIMVYGSTCDDFTVNVMVTLNDPTCSSYQTSAPTKTVVADPSTLTKNYFENGASSVSNLCKYPNGTYQSEFCVTQNDCASYLWYTQTHGVNTQTTRDGGGSHIGLGFKRLTIIGNNTSACALVRAIEGGSSKVYCNVSVGNNQYTIVFDVDICEDVPPAPAYIDGPSEIEKFDWGYYTYPTVSCAYSYHRWSSDQQGLKVIGPYSGGLDIDVQGRIVGTYNLNVSGINACGEGLPRTNQVSVINFKTVPINDSDSIAGFNNIKVYPNPVNDKLTIEINDNIAFKMVSILSISGEVIHKQKITNLKTSIDVSNLPSGLYILLFSGSGDSIQYKEKLLITKK